MFCADGVCLRDAATEELLQLVKSEIGVTMENQVDAILAGKMLMVK